MSWLPTLWTDPLFSILACTFALMPSTKQALLVFRSFFLIFEGLLTLSLILVLVVLSLFFSFWFDFCAFLAGVSYTDFFTGTFSSVFLSRIILIFLILIFTVEKRGGKPAYCSSEQTCRVESFPVRCSYSLPQFSDSSFIESGSSQSVDLHLGPHYSTPLIYILLLCSSLAVFITVALQHNLKSGW